MEKHSITIKCNEKANELNKLSELINSFNGNLGKFHVARKTEREVLNLNQNIRKWLTSSKLR